MDDLNQAFQIIEMYQVLKSHWKKDVWPPNFIFVCIGWMYNFGHWVRKFDRFDTLNTLLINGDQNQAY